jgi:hypothetical protein
MTGLTFYQFACVTSSLCAPGRRAVDHIGGFTLLVRRETCLLAVRISLNLRNAARIGDGLVGYINMPEHGDAPAPPGGDSERAET